MIRSVSDSHVAVSSSLMNPAIVGSPESTIGAAYTHRTAAAAANAGHSSGFPRPLKPTARPATAIDTTTGAANRALASARVKSCPTTTITAKPAIGTRGVGRRRFASSSTSSPQPAQRASISAGNTSQATIRSTWI